ncbi:MAG: hypothetical protein AAGA69_04315 [Pseudomonadota bacterium]
MSLPRHLYRTWLRVKHHHALARRAQEQLPEQSLRRAPPGRVKSLEAQFDLMKPEFGGKSALTFSLYCAVIRARRGLQPARQAELIRHGLLYFPDIVYRDMNTRWLVSFLNTIADHGARGEAEAARTLTTFLHMVKVYETLFKPGHIDKEAAITSAITHMHSLRPYGDPDNFAGLELWDYMFTMDLEQGDVIENLFIRLRDERYPLIVQAFDFIHERLRSSPTVFGTILARNTRMEP